MKFKPYYILGISNFIMAAIFMIMGLTVLYYADLWLVTLFFFIAAGIYYIAGILWGIYEKLPKPKD